MASQFHQQRLFVDILEADAAVLAAALGRELVTGPHFGDAGERLGVDQAQMGRSRRRCGHLVADQAQVADHAPPLLRGRREALVGLPVDVVAEDVARMGDELEQDNAEIRLERSVHSGSLAEIEVDYGLPETVVVARYVVDDLPVFAEVYRRHLCLRTRCAPAALQPVAPQVHNFDFKLLAGLSGRYVLHDDLVAQPAGQRSADELVVAARMSLPGSPGRAARADPGSCTRSPRRRQQHLIDSGPEIGVAPVHLDSSSGSMPNGKPAPVRSICSTHAVLSGKEIAQRWLEQR